MILLSVLFILQCFLYLQYDHTGVHSPEERSPQMAQMCLVSDRAVPEGWAGTFITPLSPSGGLMSSVLLTEFIGEFSWNINTHKHTHRQVTKQTPELRTSDIIYLITRACRIA